MALYDWVKLALIQSINSQEQLSLENVRLNFLDLSSKQSWALGIFEFFQ